VGTKIKGSVVLLSITGLKVFFTMTIGDFVVALVTNLAQYGIVTFKTSILVVRLVVVRESNKCFFASA